MTKTLSKPTKSQAKPKTHPILKRVQQLMLYEGISESEAILRVLKADWEESKKHAESKDIL